jgi:hypothetical protein
MESSINQSYLCQQLIEINKKYESCTFVDIDFIDLYGLSNSDKSNIDLNIIKKKIITKYYNLALKYHPDKYINNEESIINVKNCFINIDEIKSGEFIAFINDIHELLINLIIEEPESLINIINGNTEDVLNKYDLNADHNILKRRYNNEIKTDYERANEDQIKKFEDELKNSLIIDNKLTKEDLEYKTILEKDKRKDFQVEKVFNEEQLNKLGEFDENGKPKFNLLFNSVFEDHKEIIINETQITNTNNESFDNAFQNQEIQEIQAYNSVGSLNTLAYGSLANTISDLSEAFSPIKVNKNNISEQLTYDQLMVKREEQDKIFKNAKSAREKKVIVNTI